jgi:RND family efflux transporter MFP subunit
MTNTMKKILVGLLSAGLVLLAADCAKKPGKKDAPAGGGRGGWHGGGRPEKPKGEYKVIEVYRTNIQQVMEESGEIAPVTTANIASRISGRVISLLIKEGTFVNKGASLAIVEPDASQARSLTGMVNGLEDAKQEFLKREDDYKVQKDLFSKGYIPEQTFRDSETAYDRADRNYKAKLVEIESAKKELGMGSLAVRQLPIVSPLSGIVLNRYVEEGELITGDSSLRDGTKLFTVADLSRLVIKIDVNEVDIYKLDLGMKVAIHINANPVVKYTGTIYKISPYAENKNGVRSFTTEIKIDQDDRKLRPGMSAVINLKLNARQGVVAVPVTAIFVDDKQEYVYAPGKSGGAEKIYVKRGLNDENSVEIVSGLQPGMKIFSDIPYKELANQETFVPPGGKK